MTGPYTMTKSQPYTLPADLLGTDYAANLAFFLLENTGSICGRWAGSMPAKDQRVLFGRFLGKGRLVINGQTEALMMFVKVCFGTDSDMRENIAWRDLDSLNA
jgi:hypothetical protein